MLSLSSAPALAKTVAECNAEYAANKDSIKASSQTKKDYVAACRAGTATAPVAAPAAPAAAAPAPAAAPATAVAPAGGKTAKECNAEYSENKAAIKAGGQKKADFIGACRAGNETIPTAPAPAAAAPPPAAAPAPAPAAAAPAPAPAGPQSMKPQVATGAGQFQSDAQAKARCPSDTVVWVNTKSGIYHFAGMHNYGNTKQGAYMCEADAKGAGDRAAENEKHP
jgi:hypothetical protein